MPNHITNILTVQGGQEEIDACLAYIVGEKDEDGHQRLIDFDKIIPAPKHIFMGNLSSVDEERRGKKHCWYDWSIYNWGTKWNAYQISRDGNVVRFDTAWNMPDPIFRELSALFPNLTFHVDYADEDIGSNCGTCVYQNGEPPVRIEPESPRKFALQVKGRDDRDDREAA